LELTFATSINPEWRRPPPDLALSDWEIHFWRASLNLPPRRVRQLARRLSPDEEARAAAFCFDRDRQQFIVCRGLLRAIISRYLGVAGELIRFDYGAFGKPALANGSGEGSLRFNLSHSRGLALYAITRNREIGVDLEYIRPIANAEQIAARCFSAREQQTLRSLQPDQQPAAFFQYWTRTEAYVKATGAGLSLLLDSFDVSLAALPGGAPRIVSADTAAPSGWLFQTLTPHPGYVGGLAAQRPPGQSWIHESRHPMTQPRSGT
jgi:4'-phosphopantetheinyl transferase